MLPREVAVCQDEDFHPDICRVAIEPVSIFILGHGQVQPVARVAARFADRWARLKRLA